MAELLQPVMPSLTIENLYRDRLDDLLRRMRYEIVTEVIKWYQNTMTEVMAQDSALINRFFDTKLWLAKKRQLIAFDRVEPLALFGSAFDDWILRYDQASMELAFWFTAENSGNAAYLFESAITQAAGVPLVNLQITPRIQTALEAVLKENVGLIKKVQSQYLTQVLEITRESILKGRDLYGMSQALQERFGVAENRAILIARDQNNKATALFDRERRLDVGITEAMWIHTSAAMHPRASHVAAHGTIYKVEDGCLIDGEYIQPAEKINCHCISRAYLPQYGSTWDGLLAGETRIDRRMDAR